MSIIKYTKEFSIASMLFVSATFQMEAQLSYSGTETGTLKIGSDVHQVNRALDLTFNSLQAGATERRADIIEMTVIGDGFDFELAAGSDSHFLVTRQTGPDFFPAKLELIVYGSIEHKGELFHFNDGIVLESTELIHEFPPTNITFQLKGTPTGIVDTGTTVLVMEDSDYEGFL